MNRGCMDGGCTGAGARGDLVRDSAVGAGWGIGGAWMEAS